MPTASKPDTPARSRLFWVLAGAFLAAQLISDATHGLSVDEAHYALYAYFLDWSYFDHPPLVGWVQLPALWLGGGDFLLRLAPLGCWVLMLFLLHRLSRRLFGEREARFTVLIALLVPMFHLLGMSLHPDTLLLPLTCAAMLSVWRLRDPIEVGRIRLWLGLGAILGLAGLAKYPAIFLAASSAGILLHRHGRRVLAQPGPWLASALALVLISPVLIWNARHHGVSFRYQGMHAAGAGAWEAREVLRILWSQLKIYGPLTVVAIALGAAANRRSSPAAFCLAFALPPLVVIFLLAGRGGSLDYWSAFGWLATLPLAGAGLARFWRARAAKACLRTVAAIQLWFCLLVFIRVWLGGPPETSSIHQNPFADLYGWDRAALRARELARARGLDSITVMNWTLASRMAWYSRPEMIYVLDRRYDQIAMWYGKLPAGHATILVQWSRLPYEMPVQPDRPRGFARARLLERMPVSHLGDVISHFDFYLCEDWGGEAVSAPMPGNWISAF